MLSRRTMLVAGLLVTASACSSAEEPGTADLDRWVRRYVELLNAKDEPQLAGHLNRKPGDPQDQGANDPADRLAQYGGQALKVDRIATSSEFPHTYKVTITATTGAGKAVTMSETVGWSDGKWMMAPLRPTLPSGAATTERPTG